MNYALYNFHKYYKIAGYWIQSLCKNVLWLLGLVIYIFPKLSYDDVFSLTFLKCIILEQMTQSDIAQCFLLCSVHFCICLMLFQMFTGCLSIKWYIDVWEEVFITEEIDETIKNRSLTNHISPFSDYVFTDVCLSVFLQHLSKDNARMFVYTVGGTSFKGDLIRLDFEAILIKCSHCTWANKRTLNTSPPRPNKPWQNLS